MSRPVDDSKQSDFDIDEVDGIQRACEHWIAGSQCKGGCRAADRHFEVGSGILRLGTKNKAARVSFFESLSRVFTNMF